MEQNYRKLEFLLDLKRNDGIYTRNNLKDILISRIDDMGWSPRLTIIKSDDTQLVLEDYMHIFEFIRKLK